MMRDFFSAGETKNIAKRVTLQGRKERMVQMMKRTLLIIAILALSVAPAMAAVTVSAIQEVPSAASGAYSATRQCNVIDINYVCSASERVRAFAIEVTLDNGFTFTNVTDYNTGESSALTGKKTGYGIFPGSFRDIINPAGPNWVDSNYKPIAPNTDGVDANGTGLGTRKVIIEAGSLYVGDTNKPPASGTLCRLWVSTGQDNITTGFGPKDCNIQIAVNTIRGGVVLEDGTAVTPTLVARGLVSAGKISFPECFPCWGGYAAQYNEYMATFKPACWCGWQTGSANYRVQCAGDADNKTQDLVGKYRVFTSDYNKLVAAWQKSATKLRFGDANLLCADFDHRSQDLVGKYRVFTSDYAILVAGWQKTETKLRPGGWCPR